MSQRTRKIATTSLPLAKLRTDGGTQPRGQLEEEVVQEYAAAYQAKAALPPLVAFFDGKIYWLVDGFHRLAALQVNGTRSAQVEVHPGTQIEAIWFTAGANQSHGLRRTNEDKQRAVTMALQSAAEMKPQPSSRQIAEHVGVDHKTVEKYRSTSLRGNSPQAEGRFGSDGRKLPAKAPKSAPPNPDAEDVEEDDTTAAVTGPVFDELGQEITDPEIASAFVVLRPRILEVAHHLDAAARSWGAFHKAQAEAKQVRLLNARSYDYARNMIERDAKQLAFNLQSQAPYAICPYCQGAPFAEDITKRCRGCGGGGWIDKPGYDSAPPEKKAARAGAGVRHG